MRADVVVMGAGPAGLAAANVLAENGYRSLVLEKDGVVGGISRTVERDGFRFDLGGHRWFTKDDEVNRFFLTTLGDELIEVDRTSRIYFNGRYFYYPLKVSNSLREMGLARSAGAVVDYVWTRAAGNISPRPVDSMEDAYISQFGRRLYEMFFQAYSEKVWGRPCSEMSGDWVDQRSKGLSLLTAVKDALFKSNGQVVSLVDRFLYPKLGIGRFPQRMAAAVDSLGSKVELRAEVVSVVHDGQRIRDVIVNMDGRKEAVSSDSFISSIPITALVKLLSPAAPSEVLAAAKALKYRDLITVNIMLAREQVTSDTWMYVHDRNIGFGRLHEPRNWSRHMAPDGLTSLVVEYFCTAGDAIWGTRDETICELAVADLADKLRFIERSEVIDAFAVRCPKAYPAYVLGYQGPLKIVREHLRSFANLQTIGRYGTFRYNNMDHSVETGIMAARNILGECHNIDTVNADREYLEEKRSRVA